MRLTMKSAIISAIVGAAVAGAIGIGWDSYNKKPIIDYTLSKDTTFFYDPAENTNDIVFVNQPEYQTMKLKLNNRGYYDGSVLVTIIAKGAQVAFPSQGLFDYSISANHYVQAQQGWIEFNYNLKPVDKAQSITVSMSVAKTGLFDQITPPAINNLIYEREGIGYRLQ
jgi:hypothetical protein